MRSRDTAFAPVFRVPGSCDWRLDGRVGGAARGL